MWVSREAGSLLPSVFSLFTQLLALAYIIRDVGADQFCSGCQWEMGTCQHQERLAPETTADKDTRLQQVSELQHKLKVTS